MTGHSCMVSLFHQDTVSRGARNLIDDSSVFFLFFVFLHQMFWLAFNNIFLEKNGVVYSQLDGEELRVCPRKAIKTISFKMRNTFKDLFNTIF